MRSISTVLAERNHRHVQDLHCPLQASPKSPLTPTTQTTVRTGSTSSSSLLSGDLFQDLESVPSRRIHSATTEIATIDEAIEVMRQRLERFNPCIGGENLTVLKSGKCQFMSGSIKIELSVREDRKAVVVSCVVHRLNHQEILQTGQKQQKNNYSLMTKMMKYNTMLNKSGGGQFGQYDGKMVYFRTVDMGILIGDRNRGEFYRVLEDYMMTAAEASRDFRATTENKKRAFF